jgi:hypothetical protein
MIIIVKMTPEESRHYSRLNPLIEANRIRMEYERQIKNGAILSRAKQLENLIQHIEYLIAPQIDREKSYFTVKSGRSDVLEFRQQIIKHFQAKEIQIKIRGHNYESLIFVQNLKQINARTY